MQVFFIMFWKNKISLIVIHWKVACEIFRNIIGKDYTTVRLCMFYMQLNLVLLHFCVIFRCIYSYSWRKNQNLLISFNKKTCLIIKLEYYNFKMFNWLILVLLSLFSFIHPKCFYKSRLLEHPVYNSLKMYNALILILIILFCRITPNVNV